MPWTSDDAQLPTPIMPTRILSFMLSIPLSHLHVEINDRFGRRLTVVPSLPRNARLTNWSPIAPDSLASRAKSPPHLPSVATVLKRRLGADIADSTEITGSVKGCHSTPFICCDDRRLSDNPLSRSLASIFGACSRGRTCCQANSSFTKKLDRDRKNFEQKTTETCQYSDS